jgi:hypothetical protein
MERLNGTRTKQVCLGVALTAVLGVASCSLSNVQTGELQTDRRSVKLGNAKSVRVEIHMGAGELKVGGGATDLLDAHFTYNVPAWKPEVEYNVTAAQGHLTIQQPQGTSGSGKDTRYEWDLFLNNRIPIDMSVQVGAGRTDLTLGTLSLTNLNLEMGAGESTVDLTGNWKNDLAAQIRGGVGKATIRLPSDVGVRVSARGGIGAINAHDFKKDGGAYVNDVYGRSPVTLRVDVEGGVGEIDLELGSSPPIV